MTYPLVLASGSSIRAKMLENAGLRFEIAPVKIDESSIKASLQSEDAHPRDIADTLAELKAQKAAQKHVGDALVLGCDQVLEHQGQLLSKPKTPQDAIDQLKKMSGGMHTLYSSAVLYRDLKPIWRKTNVAQMYVRQLSEDFVENYVAENWSEIQYCVGCYQIENQGVQLFSQIKGDHFTIMGLPLLDLLGYLRTTGWMNT
ncbi:Maf family protein [Algirhabdus cladophorae]|uniref:Maf family protein n=1 Tax=Algirhabdus cladophorae TaxID=3377108 RepID=UPI003B8479C7